jgi:hypothetical protein
VIGWSRQVWEALRPYGNGGAYLNSAGFEGETDLNPAETFGASIDRLEAVRVDYDPHGLFTGAAAPP